MTSDIKIAAMLRIKNEERWIERCLRSVSEVASHIVILDDGSTDRTPEICRSFPGVTRYEYLSEPGVDEVRDKNRLLRWTLELNPDWILCLDGDEELGRGAKETILDTLGGITRHNPEYAVFWFRFLYFWNDPNTVRTDGIYADIWHPRLFTTWNQDPAALMFQYHRGHRSGFHCGSVPGGLVGMSRKLGVLVKHYGYLDPNDRRKKHSFYRENDPRAFAGGYYDHLISTDANIESFSGEADEQRFLASALPYHSFDPSPGGVHMMALEMCRGAKRVLDVGCGAGHLGRELKKTGCFVAGVEPDPQAAQRARKVLDEVIGEGGETFHREDLLGSFDAILLLDILEHTREPLLVLSNLRKYLAKNGFFVISVPNFAHWTTRLKLLRGRFDYEDYGILDRTHLRHFTLKSLLGLLKDAGLLAQELKYVLWPDAPFYRSRMLYPLRKLGLLEPLVKKLGPGRPGLFAYQFLVKAAPGGTPR